MIEKVDMMPYKVVPIFLLWLLGAAISVSAYSQPAAPQKQAAPIDQIVAVVNDDVITLYELENRLNIIEQQLKKQGTPLPELGILKKQVLERMITDMLLAQFAKETGVRVDDAQLDKALRRIAQENNFTALTAFRNKLELDGVDYNKFREEIRNEIIAARLREREIDSKLVVSDGEVENYLSTQVKQSGKNVEYQIAHILILVPDQADAATIQGKYRRAMEAVAELKKGADFAQIAAGYSDAKDALQGGNLGWRIASRLPALFQNALREMRPGDVRGALRSPNGFHIFKLIDQRIQDMPAVIKQTHARHILIKSSELVPESEAKRQLLEIKQRIDAGADFAEQAKRYSEDGSATRGGDLGWIAPGDTVPEFEEAMNSVKPGELSDPVQSSFGWHLIEVLERRTAEISPEQKRQQARVAIHSFKSDDAYQGWLRQLRDRAYIEDRLEKPM